MLAAKVLRLEVVAPLARRGGWIDLAGAAGHHTVVGWPGAMTLSLTAWPRRTGRWEYVEPDTRDYDTAAPEMMAAESGRKETVQPGLLVEVRSAHMETRVLDKTQCLVQVTPRGVAAEVAAARRVLA